MSTSSILARKVDARLATCAALAGAAIAAPAIHATVVQGPITNLSIPNNIDGVYVNFLTGATGTSGATVTGWDWNAYLTGGVLTFFWNNTAPSVSGGVATAVTGGAYIALAPGTTISSASTFSASSGGGGTAATAAFQVTGTETLGIRFYNEATASINYGYVVLNTTATNGFPATIVNYFYENSGGPITTPIPEPATVALLGAFAAGALGVRQWKRRRAA